jgi:hypothetical protein
MMICFWTIKKDATESIIQKLKVKMWCQEERINLLSKSNADLEYNIKQHLIIENEMQAATDGHLNLIKKLESGHNDLRSQLYGVKPAQFGALLRSYYQFQFGNPFMMKMKMHTHS